MIKFEWDENKNSQNIKKHKIDFTEASTAFLDENGLILEDIEHSSSEDRFLLLGITLKARIVVVCHCYRIYDNDDEVIRIISCRKATANEERQYVEVNKL